MTFVQFCVNFKWVCGSLIDLDVVVCPPHQAGKTPVHRFFILNTETILRHVNLPITYASL